MKSVVKCSILAFLVAFVALTTLACEKLRGGSPTSPSGASRLTLSKVEFWQGSPGCFAGCPSVALQLTAGADGVYEIGPTNEYSMQLIASSQCGKGIEFSLESSLVFDFFSKGQGFGATACSTGGGPVGQYSASFRVNNREFVRGGVSNTPRVTLSPGQEFTITFKFRETGAGLEPVEVNQVFRIRMRQ